ncbi:hypothetical protein [Christiangramia salexigens]|uniref:Energy transducer TonB n=1 Tax=Christiangramia salexigens TaxID=1913577 RepID=A0A1L3J789_9FLAO|nr:hypothetical protein [Christiangramia salexigens]APG60997.1 hypothetical protein LPB144_11515 [Christiangramia salexigens]
MDFFDRHKALIITTLLFSLLMLGLYNFNLSTRNKEVSEMLIDLEQYTLAQKEEAKQAEQKPKPAKQRSIQTNKAYNEDRETREADFNNKLNEILEKNAAEQKDSENEETNGSEGTYSVSRKNSEEKKKASEGDNSSEEIAQKSASYDYSSISFSLKGRRAVKIPNPVYTCDRAGKIVINISVNANGEVMETSVNKSSSTSTNECLTGQAMEYAAGARFSKLAGRNSQPGTITYYFKS